MEKKDNTARNELFFMKHMLKGTMATAHGLEFLRVDPSLGEGQVHCSVLDKGITAFEFDINVFDEVVIDLPRTEDPTVYLCYCLKGNCFHQSNSSSDIDKLEELQTALLFTDAQLQHSIRFKGDERTTFNCIQIHLSALEADASNPEDEIDFIALLKGYDREQGYVHLGHFNLEIGELVKKLEDIKHTASISNSLYFKGICHLIMAKQLEQFESDLNSGQGFSTTLLKKELEMISDVGDFIANYPELPHTISSISSKSALSPSKLQTGFKFMHDSTLGEFIREIRLKKAEVLIRTTDLNISQVVYSIGFTSRSYFCKIFKKKYNCSPKAYKTQAMEVAVA